MKSAFIVVALAVVAAVASAAKADPKECEVCKEVLGGIEKRLTKEDKKSLQAIEKTISEYCNEEARDRTERKVCYFIDPIKRMISQPFKNGAPSDRICKKLKAKSAEICSIRRPIKVDTATVDYTKLRVRELKASWRTDAVKNCVEKSEFVKRCKETAHLEL